MTTQASSLVSPRILISRLGTVGDAILTLPLACSLRRHFPDAYLGWVVQPETAPIVSGHHALDCVIELPHRWFRSLRGLRAVRSELREHRFDIAIDCQGNTESAVAAKCSGAARRIGFSGPTTAAMGRLLNDEKVAPVFHHITDRSLELLTPLGIHHPKVEFHLPIEPSDRRWAEQFRSTIPAPSVAILNPGGSWRSQLWEADRFASTARYLSDRYGYRSLVLWGSFEERLIAEEIVGLSNRTVSLAPDTSLKTQAALIETADLFISGDTTALHMSAALGTRTIGLYGATWPGGCGPYGQVALQLQCEAGTRRHRRNCDNRAMRAIGVEHVCAVIDEMHAGVSQVRAA